MIVWGFYTDKTRSTKLDFPANANPYVLKISGLALILVTAVILFTAIQLPGFFGPTAYHLRQKAYDASAKSAGRNAKFAEHLFYAKQPEQSKIYTSDLSQLLVVDSQLIEDPGVTFKFLQASSDGFTFCTSHEEGSGAEFFHTDKEQGDGPTSTVNQ